ncbi:protocadherin Fat 4, partial [Python bivittatus]|uniref:Protocadherin Fat 4 n=1 Tax=Python bivittatus TaxID=176946 RepID=A0A9F5JCJ7_PYTBI
MAFPLESAHDEDLGENSIQNYTLSVNEHFWLDVQRNKDGINNVDLVLKKTLDREKMPYLNLTLMAVDGGVPQKTGTVQINIDVLDINDNSPQFPQSEYKVRIKENLPKGTVVAKLEATDLDFGSNAQIIYSFHRVPERINNLFLLNERTGEITVMDQTDYEKERSYSINVRATDGGGLSGHCKVLIEVEDVNDNVPEVSIISLTSILKENSPLEKVVALFSVRDEDSGDNSKTFLPEEKKTGFPVANVLKDLKIDVKELSARKAKLVPKGSKEYFQLDPHSGNLILKDTIDREALCEAVDGGIPRRTGTAQIIIDILDANDNVPHFEQSVYKVQLAENSPPGSLVTKVAASDSDMGAYAHITYTFSQVPGNVLRSFKLNNHTGEITLVGKIDYEENSNFELNIKATDGGGLSAYCKVFVDIEDENDNAPEVTLSSVTNPLPEDYPIETVVAVFSVTDLDSGDNGRTTCNIDSNLPFMLKPTKNNYYQLVIHWPLDREQVSEYNITITAADQGSPSLSSMRIINIQISDVNDNTPVFEKSFYNLHLRENNIPGLLFGLIHAIDLDAEQNAKVTYLLLPGKIRDGPASSYISINSETGNLYAIRSIDYEDIQNFQVMVRAIDKGSPALSSETMVQVHIMDENDNAPFILCPLQNSTSPSNDLVPRGAETGYLVTKNGEVKTMRPVNNRDSFKHTLIVAVRDNGHPPQSASAPLRILLVDGFSDPYMKIMDNPKGEVQEEDDHTLTMYLIICLVTISSIFLLSVMVFIGTKLQKRQKFIGSSNSASNFPVGQNLQENCGDPSSDTHCQAYNYEVCLAGGSLNKKEISYTMEDHFIRGKQGLYLLLFLSLFGTLCISVRYSVPEEKKNGFVVANVLQDFKLKIGELSTRRACLISGSTKEYFHLDIQTGNLLINDKIDREALCGQKELCLLLSQVVLEKPLELHSIEIQIEDVNDNAPNFTKNTFTVQISEHVPVNTRILMESAQDADLGKNGIQNYTLTKNSHFTIEVQIDEHEKKNVDLILQKPLDREKMPYLQLTLMAVDGGVPQKTGTVQINIDVLDINDNSPQFSQSEYKVRIKENLPKGTLLIKVEARDPDFGSHAQILYSFHRVPERISNLFFLNERTGETTVCGQIDYERERSYGINIKATDGGGLSGHCKILIEIEDENDNPPEVSIISLTRILKEDSPPDTMVALFSVRDQDSGENSKTVCSVDTNLPFVLKATANDLYQLVLQSPLDRETLAEYNITITAIDWGSPRLTSTRMINVQISDVNDNPPLFEKSLYDMQIHENNIPGLLIGSVHAVDLDTKLNAKVTYLLLPGKGDGLVPSYISINSETGNVYALRSLDYEQIREFRVTVRATDGGSPSLSSEVVVRIIIIDENDNTPFFLYPLQNSTSLCNELVPKSAEAGYLVTKVVAVDGDSGQNSWLSYELLKATDPGLFSIEVQNGKVKTRRALNERDANKQKLVILVRDNGFPPQTSTAVFNILVVDGFSDPFLRRVDVSVQEPEEDKTLTKYLVICLIAVSFVFLVCIVVFIVVKICKKDPRGNFTVVPPHFPPPNTNTFGNCDDSENGSLSRTYHYDVCLTGGSLSSEFRFLRPIIPVFSVGDINIPESHRTSSGSQDIVQQISDNQLKEK